MPPRRHDLRISRFAAWPCGCAVLALGWTIILASSLWADEPTTDTSAVKPATVAEATALLDLVNLPLLAGAAETKQRRAAVLNYTVPGTVRDLFAKQKKQLADQKWEPVDDLQTSPRLASGTFTRDGFALAVSLYPYGMKGEVMVALTHLGNVPLQKLPVPGNARLLFPGVAGAAFLTDMPVAEAAPACRKLLTEQGWQPYGLTAQALVLKQNAVRLTVQVVPAPDKSGLTVVSYSACLMSADLPALPDATQVEYQEERMQLVFDTKADREKVVDFYRQTLAKAGWAPAAEKADSISANAALVLENPSHNRITVTIEPLEKGSHVWVVQQSTAELKQPAAEKQ
jgi:hypothetical protein